RACFCTQRSGKRWTKPFLCTDISFVSPQWISQQTARPFVGNFSDLLVSSRARRPLMKRQHASGVQLAAENKVCVPPSADLAAPKGRLVGGEVPIRRAEIALQLDRVAGGERGHRLKPERRRLGDMRAADLAGRATDLS